MSSSSTDCSNRSIEPPEAADSMLSGQPVHPVEQPALFRLAQRQSRRVRLRGIERHLQPCRDHVIVDRHVPALRDLADPLPTPIPGTRS